MRTTLFSFAIFGYCLAAFGQAEELDEIVLPHYNWGGYPAYFFSAPKSIRTSMVQAVHNFCSKTSAIMELGQELELKGEEETAEFLDAKMYWESVSESYWICEEGALSFFSGMTGLLKVTKWGYVCGETVGMPEQRYFSEAMLRDWAGCVRISWDEEREKHLIAVPGDA